MTNRAARTSQHRLSGPLLICLTVLWSCDPGLDSAGSQPSSSATAATTQPESDAYPELRLVPPRPRLSYSIEQRREIANGLVRDREHALYMERQLRYQIGEAEEPPPPPAPERGPAEMPRPDSPEPEGPATTERGISAGPRAGAGGGGGSSASPSW